MGHHERWDGKGYPRGIAQEEIPVGPGAWPSPTCFDAMTTDRPYRRGLPVEYALQQIEGGAGTQFDPTWRRYSCSWCVAGLCQCAARGFRSAEKKGKDVCLLADVFFASGPREELFRTRRR